MHILHYNILNGFNTGTLSIEPLKDFLAKERIDVLMLNEYRSSPPLDAALESLGYVHVAINSFYPVPNQAAIFSRVEIENVVYLPATYRLVWIAIKGINFISYHASPAGVEAVLSEVESIIEQVREVDRIILSGDVNSLSLHDYENLNYAKLAGTTATERYSLNGILSFEALNLFEKDGFLDNRTIGLQNTVPTTLYREHELGAALRLDYVLSRNVAIADVAILRGSPFDVISDHFPLSFTVKA